MIKIKKRGMTASTLIGLLIAIVSFLVVFLVIDVAKLQAEERTAEELCRISIATREKTSIEVKKWGFGTEVKVAPLICPTAKSEDVGKGMTKDEVTEYIAKKIARCWYKYQEGLVEDVFEGSTFKDKCQICYPLNIKKWDDYDEKGDITSADLVEFMYNTPYKVIEESDSCKLFGGECKTEEKCDDIIDNNKYFKSNDDTKCKKQEENKICCYSPYDCLNKGGICSYDAPDITSKKYDKWNCPSGTGECWIKEENYYSYLEYVQSYGGLGVVAVLTENVEPGKSYAISFASPTEDCGDFCELWALPGILTTAGGVITIAAGVWTLNPAIIIAGVKIAAGGAVMLGAGVGGAELVTAVNNALKERHVNTVYLSTLNDVTYNNICEDVT